MTEPLDPNTNDQPTPDETFTWTGEPAAGSGAGRRCHGSADPARSSRLERIVERRHDRDRDPRVDPRRDRRPGRARHADRPRVLGPRRRVRRGRRGPGRAARQAGRRGDLRRERQARRAVAVLGLGAARIAGHEPTRASAPHTAPEGGAPAATDVAAAARTRRRRDPVRRRRPRADRAAPILRA